ncbi:hypothetical protein NGA_2002600, partial [Nannochloropsis gaditana CCMP526]|uniref:uncharacterized protein n=1 Tax=Nannochloropsis gaditana (strain CCMP526) TaxID=1093141 RepID=UPI00029F5460
MRFSECCDPLALRCKIAHNKSQASNVVNASPLPLVLISLSALSLVFALLLPKHTAEDPAMCCCPLRARASSSGVVWKSSTYLVPSMDRSLLCWAERASSTLENETKASPVKRPSARKMSWMSSESTVKP